MHFGNLSQSKFGLNISNFDGIVICWSETVELAGIFRFQLHLWDQVFFANNYILFGLFDFVDLGQVQIEWILQRDGFCRQLWFEHQRRLTFMFMYIGRHEISAQAGIVVLGASQWHVQVWGFILGPICHIIASIWIGSLTIGRLPLLNASLHIFQLHLVLKPFIPVEL